MIFKHSSITEKYSFTTEATHWPQVCSKLLTKNAEKHLNTWPKESSMIYLNKFLSGVNESSVDLIHQINTWLHKYNFSL